MNVSLPKDLEIRRAQPDDAAALIEHVRRVCEEAADTTPMTAEEFDVTVEQERTLLGDALGSENDLFLVAVTGGAVVGMLSCRGEKRRAMRHVVRLGMSIRKAWWGRGIGTEMMRGAIAWARGTGVVRRIELMVYADNARAIRLYRKFGFVEEGRRRGAVLRDGVYIDDLVMALMV